MTRGCIGQACHTAAALLLLLLAGCIPATDTGAGSDAGQVAQQGRALSSFHQALSSLSAGKINRVSIVQFGDSHTAADHFSSRLRELFQERFGNAGRGMMPPGYPFPYWRPYQVDVKQSADWQVLSSNRPAYAQVPYGVSGFIARSTKGGSTMTLQAKPEARFDSVGIDFFRQPAGGQVSVIVDGRQVEQISTRGTTYALDHKTIAVPPGSSQLELRTAGDGPVDIADWSVWRSSRGVVLSSFGFSGAQVGIMDRWDSANVAQQLRQLSPALIILAFGTNEGFASPASLAEYASIFESRLVQLRAAQPSASIVIVGPPDANRLPDYCGIRGPARENTSCVPLTSTEAAGYDSLLAGRDRRLCRWHTPAGIAIVRDAQRNAAAKSGAFFWDWSSVQGGDCGATRWVPQQLGRQDRVHMYENGYTLSAERLFEELLKSYRSR